VPTLTEQLANAKDRVTEAEGKLAAAKERVAKLEAKIKGDNPYPVGTIIRGDGDSLGTVVLVYVECNNDPREGESQSGEPVWVGFYDDFSGESFETYEAAVAHFDSVEEWEVLYKPL
jgi:hypothetical protein